MTRSERSQVEAINAYLSNLGLKEGVFVAGKKHGKFVYEDDVIGKITCTIACTPRSEERSTTIALGNFKRIFKIRLSEMTSK